MAEQPGHGTQTLTAVDRDRRERVAEIVNAQPRQPRRRADRVPCLVHRYRPAAGRREHPGAVGPPLLRREDSAGGRRKPDRARTRLAAQHRAVAVNVFPLELQRLGTCARQRKAGSTPRRRRPDGLPLRRRAPDRAQRTPRPAGSTPRSMSCAAAALARIGVLPPQSERLGMPHHRRQPRQRAARRPSLRSLEIVEPVVQMLHAARIDPPIIEGRQHEPLHVLPAFSSVGEERRREVPHRRDRRRCALRFGIVSQVGMYTASGCPLIALKRENIDDANHQACPPDRSPDHPHVQRRVRFSYAEQSAAHARGAKFPCGIS